MKKSKFLMFASSLLLVTSLVSCKEDDSLKSTIKLAQNENAELISSLDINKEYMPGTRGLLTIKPLNKYEVLGAKQTVDKKSTDLLEVYGIDKTYTFVLAPGSNKLEAIMSDTPVYDPCKIVIDKTEHATVTTSLDDKEKVHAGDYGVLKVEIDPGYRVKEVKQNGTITLKRIQNEVNSFNFFLKEETNTFKVYLEETKSYPDATLEIPEIPNVTISTTFPETGLKAGDRGLVKVLMNQKYYAKNFKFNGADVAPTSYKEEATYLVVLKEGSNTFTFETYRKIATIKILENENVVSAVSSLDVETEHDANDTGTLTITCAENFLVEKIVQSSVVTLEKDYTSNVNNVFKFKLIQGENTFKIYTKEYHNIYGPNDLIEGEDNIPSRDGELSEDIDERPGLGNDYMPVPPIKLPDYGEGTKVIYFSDLGWWNSGLAKTNIVCYNANKEIINPANNDNGTSMKHISYDAESTINVWQWAISSDTAYVQFKRYSSDGHSYWDAKTDILPVPDFTTSNGYKITGGEAWKENITEVSLNKIEEPAK